MAILVDNDTRLVVQGLTGSEGRFHGLRNRDYQYAMFLAKGSLFLGRMTHMSDGESFILETNPAAR